MRLALAAGLIAAALIPQATAALAAAPPRPDASRQPLRDGCQRNPSVFVVVGATGLDVSPEWVYVNRDRTVRVAEGRVTSARPAGEDTPRIHAWYDIGAELDVDRRYGNLLGGDPAKKTGNFGGNGEDTDRLQLEWESGSGAAGTLPPFAWPTAGDRVKAWGQWIWDCGHWGQGFEDPDFFFPGSGELPSDAQIRGESSELHPLRAIVVTRADPARSPRPESQSDVFISSDGTPARTEEECAREHPPLTFASYGPDYTACAAAHVGARAPVNDRDYRFLVPAPPRPSRRAKLYYRVVDVARGNGPHERVRVRTRDISVTVPFKGFGNATQRLVYGKTFYVGWREPGRRPRAPAHLRVTFTRLRVIHSLDPNPGHLPRVDPPPAEWVLYVDVGGEWRLVNDWARGMNAVSDGDVLPLSNGVVDLYPRAGHGLRIASSGRECDLPQIQPCPPTLAEGSDTNDNPGTVIQRFPYTSAALGDHVLRSVNYELSYSVHRAR